MSTPPPPQASPQPPQDDDVWRPPTGEVPAVHLATNTEVKRWGLVPAVVAGLASVLGTGGIISFLLGFAGESRAQAVRAAEQIITVQSSRIDVLKGDVDIVKVRLEAVDAGVAENMRRLEQKVEESDRRSQARADEQEKILHEVLREVRKR